jgi:hypothetical protein
MAGFAVGFEQVPTPLVFSIGNGFQVIGVHTRRDPTFVI